MRGHLERFAIHFRSSSDSSLSATWTVEPSCFISLTLPDARPENCVQFCARLLHRSRSATQQLCLLPYRSRAQGPFSMRGWSDVPIGLLDYNWMLQDELNAIRRLGCVHAANKHRL